MQAAREQDRKKSKSVAQGLMHLTFPDLEATLALKQDDAWKTFIGAAGVCWGSCRSSLAHRNILS